MGAESVALESSGLSAPLIGEETVDSEEQLVDSNIPSDIQEVIEDDEDLFPELSAPFIG